MTPLVRDRSSVVLVAAFLVLGAGFVGSTLYAEIRASAIDREVSAVAINSMPSVEHLVAARGALRHVEVAAEDFARARPDHREVAKRALVAARTELTGEVAAELTTPNYEGEKAASESADRDLAKLGTLLDRWLVAPPAEGDADDLQVHALVDRTDEGLQRWLSINAKQGQEGVARIIDIRRDSMTVALGLDSVCLALAAFAATLALRALRKQREAEELHERALVERADDLESFAKRVAHDLLSPLSALSFCLQAFKRSADTDAKLADALRRARACVGRAQTMVDGIFEFARSGASAASAGRADVRQVVEQVLEEAREVETGAELVLEPFESQAVACSSGVLMSILANVVRNAVKYMSDSETKRITVRVEELGASTRIEVEDTGPGVPDGMESSIFEPYVRAPGVTQAGLGLGLATVKRLCEAYGGAVGVRRGGGGGAVFWVTLPSAR